MDIDTFLWQKRMTMREFAIMVGVTEVSIQKYKQRKNSPNLLIALKIVKASEGEITLHELLKKEDVEAYEKWVQS